MFGTARPPNGALLPVESSAFVRAMRLVHAIKVLQSDKRYFNVVLASLRVPKQSDFRRGRAVLPPLTVDSLHKLAKDTIPGLDDLFLVVIIIREL